MYLIELFSKIEMIKAVREYLQGNGFTLRSDYDPIFEPARVPIFGSKGEDEQVFVDIITEQNIDADAYYTKERVFSRSTESHGLTIHNSSSAQFFRHYFPNARVYWAIPSYANLNADNHKPFIEGSRNGFIGLLEVKKIDSTSFKVSEILSSMPLQEERKQLIERTIGNSLSRTKKDKIGMILNKWSQEDISYLVFYPEPKYLAPDISVREGDYNISRELINKLGELKNISYRKVLSDFSKKYYVTPENDYSIALKVIEELWKHYDIEFPKLHRDFEQILKLDPKYRDHFLHSFQVFLYGVFVIDSMYPQINQIGFSNEEGDRIEDSWLIAATYHDFNYMIQKFEKWTKDFFKSALFLSEEDNNPASIQLTESYVKRGYMFNTKIILDTLSIKADSQILNFLYDRILIKKNHGFISGLSLLKYLEDKKTKLTRNSINNACKAISIHDSGIWRYLSGLAEESPEDDIGNIFNKKNLIQTISYDKDPISFLLILSDSLQEEGRSRDAQNKAELERLYCKDGKIFSEISFTGDKSADPFNWKIKELKLVSKFLLGGHNFEIKVIDINTKEHHVILI